MPEYDDQDGPITADRFWIEAGYGSRFDGDCFVWTCEPVPDWLTRRLQDADLEGWLAQGVIEPVQSLISGARHLSLSSAAAARLFVMGALEVEAVVAQRERAAARQPFDRGHHGDVTALQHCLAPATDLSDDPDRIGLEGVAIRQQGRSYAAALCALGYCGDEAVYTAAASDWIAQLRAAKAERQQIMAEIDRMIPGAF